MVVLRSLGLMLLAGCAPVVAPLPAPASLDLASNLVDVHYHAPFAGRSSIELRDTIVRELDRDRIGVAVVSLTDYGDTSMYDEAFDDRFVSAIMLGCPRNTQGTAYWCFPSTAGWADLAWLENELRTGRVEAIHEVVANYNGIPVSDPRYEPYFALAAKYDVPVGIHTQRGPGPTERPRANPGCCPGYHSDAGNPAHLRPVLDRHPRLRVWIQHVGAGPPSAPPHWEETLALLRDYPRVHLDMSITNSLMPAANHEAALKRLIDAGFGDRIMFGSDNMSVAESEKRLDAVDWLTDAQRTAIRRGNAARFFRLRAL